MNSKLKFLLPCLSVVAACAEAHAQESASGIINEVSTQGSGASQTFTYDIALTNTGPINIETFWYAWIPPDNIYDFLKSKPTSETSPTGWTANLEGLNNGRDDSSIQWVTTADPLTPGSTLNFGFTTPDNFATVTGASPDFGFPTGYSYVYSGAPEADNGGFFNVAAGSVPEPASFSIIALASSAVLTRRRRSPVPTP
jgi:hypothetical protein